MKPQISKDIVHQETPNVVTTKRRPLLFLATYLIGVIIATGIFAYLRYRMFLRLGYDWDWSDEIGEIFGEFLVALFFLPGGLARVIAWILNAIGIDFKLMNRGPFPGPASDLAWLLIGLSYLSYFILLVAGSLTKKQRTFRVLFITFIGLLIINIAGCSMA